MRSIGTINQLHDTGTPRDHWIPEMSESIAVPPSGRIFKSFSFDLNWTVFASKVTAIHWIISVIIWLHYQRFCWPTQLNNHSLFKQFNQNKFKNIAIIFFRPLCRNKKNTKRAAKARCLKTDTYCNGHSRWKFVGFHKFIHFRFALVNSQSIKCSFGLSFRPNFNRISFTLLSACCNNKKMWVSMLVARDNNNVYILGVIFFSSISVHISPHFIFSWFRQATHCQPDRSHRSDLEFEIKDLRTK